MLTRVHVDAGEVLNAWLLVLRLSRRRRQAGAQVQRLDSLVERATARADRKQQLLETVVQK